MRSNSNPFLLVLLGTDTKYSDQSNPKDYPFGETLGLLAETVAEEDRFILDGPDTLGRNVGAKIAEATLVILEQMKQGRTDFFLAAHSRGAVEANLVAHQVQKVLAAFRNGQRNPAANKNDLYIVAKYFQNPLKRKFLELTEDPSFDWNAIPDPTISSFLLDPVPGGGLGPIKQIRWEDPDMYGTPDFVKDSTVVIQDQEASRCFKAIVPKSDPRVKLDRTPGHHGTALGNPLTQQYKYTEQLKSSVPMHELPTVRVQEITIMRLLDALTRSRFSLSTDNISDKGQFQHRAPMKKLMTEYLKSDVRKRDEMKLSTYDIIQKHETVFHDFYETCYLGLGCESEARKDRIIHNGSLSSNEYLSSVIPKPKGFVNSHHYEVWQTSLFYRFEGSDSPASALVAELSTCADIEMQCGALERFIETAGRHLLQATHIAKEDLERILQKYITSIIMLCFSPNSTQEQCQSFVAMAKRFDTPGQDNLQNPFYQVASKLIKKTIAEVVETRMSQLENYYVYFEEQLTQEQPCQQNFFKGIEEHHASVKLLLQRAELLLEQTLCISPEVADFIPSSILRRITYLPDSSTVSGQEHLPLKSEHEDQGSSSQPKKKTLRLKPTRQDGASSSKPHQRVLPPKPTHNEQASSSTGEVMSEWNKKDLREFLETAGVFAIQILQDIVREERTYQSVCDLTIDIGTRASVKGAKLSEVNIVVTGDITQQLEQIYRHVEFVLPNYSWAIKEDDKEVSLFLLSQFDNIKQKVTASSDTSLHTILIEINKICQFLKKQQDENQLLESFAYVEYIAGQILEIVKQLFYWSRSETIACNKTPDLFAAEYTETFSVEVASSSELDIGDWLDSFDEVDNFSDLRSLYQGSLLLCPTTTVIDLTDETVSAEIEIMKKELEGEKNFNELIRKLQALIEFVFKNYNRISRFDFEEMIEFIGGQFDRVVDDYFASEKPKLAAIQIRTILRVIDFDSSLTRNERRDELLAEIDKKFQGKIEKELKKIEFKFENRTSYKGIKEIFDNAKKLKERVGLLLQPGSSNSSRLVTLRPGIQQEIEDKIFNLVPQDIISGNLDDSARESLIVWFNGLNQDQIKAFNKIKREVAAVGTLDKFTSVDELKKLTETLANQKISVKRVGGFFLGCLFCASGESKTLMEHITDSEKGSSLMKAMQLLLTQGSSLEEEVKSLKKHSGCNPLQLFYSTTSYRLYRQVKKVYAAASQTPTP